MWRSKRPRIVNITLKEKNKFRALTIPDFKTYYCNHDNVGLVNQQTNRPTDQRDRMQRPEMDPCKYSQLIFDKGTKAIEISLTYNRVTAQLKIL